MSSSCSPSSVASRSSWHVLAIVIPIYFFTMFYRLAPSVLAPDLSRDLAVGMDGVALISTATWLAYGLMQLPSGLMVDALGGRRAICLITVLAGLGNVFFALSDSLAGAVASRVLVGVGCAVCVPCCAVLAQSFRAEFYSRANSIFLALGMAGSIVAGAPLVFAAGFAGWRAVMLACAVLSFLGAAMVWFCIKEPERHAEGISEEKGSAAMRQFSLMLQNSLLVLRTAAFWPYCVWYTFMVGIYFTITSLWWAPYLREGCGLDAIQAGEIISLVCLLTLPGQAITASLSDYLQTRRGVILACSAIGLLSTLILPCFGMYMSAPLLVVQGFMFVICTGHLSAVVFAAVKELFPVNMVGAALGCLQTFPYVFAIPLMQNIFGRVLEWRIAATGDVRAAYADAMYLCVAAVFIGLVASLFMRDPIRRGKGA